MKKNLKILTLILSLAILTLAFAFAVGAESGNVAKVEGGEEYATFAEALTNVPNGGKITLVGNATMDATYTVTKSFTLDLGGKTLNITAAKAFVMDTAKDVTITGTGTINIPGTLVQSYSSTGVAYNFTVKGIEPGIDIFHSGTGDAQRIVYTKGGNNVFENVEVVSTATCDKTIRGAFQADNTAGTTSFTFNKFTYVNENYATAQNALGFLYLGGASKATIKDSAVYSAGTIVNFEYNTNTDVKTVLLNVSNSHMELITKKSAVRNQLMYMGTDDKATTFGSVYFKDSYLGGNCYRALYGDQNSVDAFHITFDHSMLHNGGANANFDSILTRGVLIKTINNSCVASTGTGIVMGNGAIQCEVGTRFASSLVAGASAIKWINADGTAASGVKTVLDPIGNSKYPYVGLVNGTSAYTFPGVTSVGMATYAAMTGSANNVYGHQVDNSSGVGGDFADFYEGYCKLGALTRYSIGDDSCLKYWVSPTAEVTYGEKRNNTTDPYFVFGDNNNYGNASAKIADTKVYVVEFDIAADPEYGFPRTSLKVTARSSANANCTTTEMTVLTSDGSFTQGALKSYDPSVKLSTQDWNHVTFVMYTDPAAKTLTAQGNANGGRTYIFVNGAPLGYFEAAYRNTYSVANDGAVTHNVAAYIQGPRFDITKTEHVVGEAFYVDNLIRRTYANYAADGESASAMNPAFYLNNNLPKNNIFLNKNITVNGHYYGTLDEALKAAMATDSYVELKGDVTVPQIVTTNGRVYTNGYTLALSNEGYGADVELDGTTVTKYVFNEAYTGEVSYNMFVENDEYRTVTYKMGRTPALDTLVVYSEGGKYKAATVTGWSTKKGGNAEVILPVSKALAESGETVNVYAVTTDEKAITSYVKDAYGKVLLGTTDDNGTNAALKALKDGETIVLCADLNYGSSTYFGNNALNSAHGVTLDNDYTDEELAKMKAVAQVIGIDVNGFTVKIFNETSFVFASNNTVVNCYSSKEGGYIYSRAATIRSGNTEYGFYGLRVFGIYNGGTETGSNAMTVSNAHINVGAYNGMYRNNLTVSGGVLFEGLTGDNSCSINVDGVIGTRSVQDSSAAIITRAYWGKITVKNSAILNPTGTHIIDLKVEDKYKYNDAHPTPYLYIEDTVLVNRGGEGDNMVSNNSASTEIAIEYKNVIANGRLNPSNDGDKKTKVNEGVGGSKCDVGTWNGPSGLKTVNYNVPMDLSKYTGKYIWKVQTPALISKTEGGVNDDIYVYIVTQGYENLVPAGAKYITLPNIKTITAFSSDIVKVNYADADGKVEKTVEYKKGGNVNTAEYTAKTLTKNAITLNPTGEWEGETKNLQANVTLTSKYTAKSNVSGLQANLSLYTDFDLNLYIPAQYKDYVSVSDGTDNIVLVPVTVGGKDYLKAVISRNSNEATVGATYVITVNEAGYTASTTATLSIASYAEAILKGESYTEADKQLMYYMLTYANEAYKYFGDKTNYDATITALLTTYADAKGEGMAPQTYAKAIENLAFGTVITEATVNLGSAPAFVFTVAEGFEGTVTVTYAGNTKTLVIEGGKATVNGMKVYNFSSDIIVTAEGTINGEAVTETSTYNLDTFVKYHVNNDAPESVACVDLLKALYDYVTCADLYTK